MARHIARQHGSKARSSAVVLAAWMLVTLPACNQRRSQRPTRPDTPPTTTAGLTTLTEDLNHPVIGPTPEDGFESTRRRVLESAALLEEMMASAESPHSESHAAFADDPGFGPEDQPGESGGPTRFSLSAFADDDEANTELAEDAAPELARGPADPDGPSEPAPSDLSLSPTPSRVATDPEERKQELVDELVGVLRELALSGEGPEASALALAGMESLRPAALDALKGDGLLSDAELASLDAARELFRAMSSRGGIADPGEVSAVLDRIRRELDARAGLRITRAELCTRVTGFGRYETFPANRFIAGRAQPVIVYAEVDRFGHRESAGPDGAPRFEIELSQRLELYHVADDLNTWNRAAEVDKTASRNRVRDYYLINQVTLPANLTIGKYHLKVVMRDVVTGGMAESIIPIEIVAGNDAGRR